MLRKLVLAAAVLGPSLLAARADAGVVINEVMYRPYNQLTFGRYEYMEVYNNGTTAVNLGGAYLTDSQDYAAVCAHTTPSDHEGIFLIPSGTVVQPGAYLTFWHASVTGVTDGPGNINYSDMQSFGNLVLNDGGDQVSLVSCSGATPTVIDALNYATLGVPQTGANVSLERIDPNGPTQSASNWGATLVPAGTNNPYGYSRGGTPGAANSLTNATCSIGSLADHVPSTAFTAIYEDDVDNAPYYYSLTYDEYSFACPTGAPADLDDAVSAVFELQDFQYWPWADGGVSNVSAMTSDLAPYYDDLVPRSVLDLAAPGETPLVHYFYATYYIAAGAHGWRHGYIVLFPTSHKIAVWQREIGET